MWDVVTGLQRVACLILTKTVGLSEVVHAIEVLYSINSVYQLLRQLYAGNFIT